MYLVFTSKPYLLIYSKWHFWHIKYLFQDITRDIKRIDGNANVDITVGNAK